MFHFVYSTCKKKSDCAPPTPLLETSPATTQEELPPQPHTQVPSPLYARPNQLDLQVKNYSSTNNLSQVQIKVQSPSNHDISPNVYSHQQYQQQQQTNTNTNNTVKNKFNFDFTPHITIQCENDDARSLSNYDSDFNRMDNSRSPSFMGYLTSASSAAITPSSTHNEIESILKSNHQYGPVAPTGGGGGGGKKQKGTLPPLLLLPPSQSSCSTQQQRNKISFNSSSSSNNLSSHKLSVNEFNFGSSLGNLDEDIIKIYFSLRRKKNH